MKETTFIDQNREKWNRFEKLSQSQAKDPDELSSSFMDITDDLSYAQTFYHRRTVRVYLNQLAQRVYTDLHIQKGESFKKLLTVWRVSLPLEIYRARKNLLFALVVFMIWFVIGAVSTHDDPDFARLVLGNGYVEMTNENIAKGDPLAVYRISDYGRFGTRGESNLSMFIGIASNNLRVAFLTFILGIFFTIGTHILLFSNGIMVGTFQYFFATKGLLLTSFLGIWIHGAFEISAIVLAAGAGITLGNGWLFPGNYTRLQSLQLAAKRGLKIMLSLVPFIILAGFLESYVTANYQDLPEWSKWALIILSFGIILGYYVVYPIYIARKYPDLLSNEEVVNTFPNTRFNFSRIRTLGQVISDTFRFYRLHCGKIFKINLLFIMPIAGGLVYLQNILHYDLMLTNHFFDWSKQLEIMMGFGYTEAQDWLVNLGWTVIYALFLLSIGYSFHSMNMAFSWKGFFVYMGKRIFSVWLGSLLLFYTLSLLPWGWYFLFMFAIPLIYLNGVSGAVVEGSLGKRFAAGWKYSARSYGNSLMTIIVFMIIMALFMQPIALVFSIHDGYLLSKPPLPDLLDMLTDFIKQICDFFNWERWLISNVVRQFVYLLFIFMVLPLWFIAMYFLVFNEHEKETAAGLRAEFEKFGKRSKVKEHDLDYE